MLSQSINHYLSENNLRRAATQKEWLGETYEELSDRKQARSAYEAAADWYEADKASALANRLLLKVGDLAALDEDYLPAIENFEKVAKHSVSNNLMRFSVKGYLLKAGICHLALDIVGTKRAIQSYKDLDPSFASQKEGQLLDDLAEAVEQGDGDAFANQLFRYDQLSKLDSWHTTILLRYVHIVLQISR